MSIRSITAVSKAPEHGSLLPVNVDTRQLEEGTAQSGDTARYYHLRLDNWIISVGQHSELARELPVLTRVCQGEVRIFKRVVHIVVGIITLMISYRVTRYFLQ